MAPSVDTVHVLSPAKINLYLVILHKRPDGYHDIQTVFQKVSLYDEITIGRASRSGISITVNDPSVPSDHTNLAYKAASIVLRDSAISSGIAITIKKRIPAGAGLGGGSSNAAATLLGLNRLFDLQLPVDRLQRFARQLGADVPFFMEPAGTALATGIGEVLTPLRLHNPFWALIVFPNIGISTGWAYAEYSKDNLLTKKEKNIMLKNYFEATTDIADILHNDFESVVYPSHPQIKKIRDSLIAEGACGAMLSGSGSSVFGLYGSREACEHARSQLASVHDARFFIAHSL